MICTEPVTIAVGGLATAHNARTASAPWLAEDGGPSSIRPDSGGKAGRDDRVLESREAGRRGGDVAGASYVTDALMAEFEQVTRGVVDDGVVVDAEPVWTQRRHPPQ